MNNKLIIFTTVFFLLLSMVYLSVAEKNQANINTKNTWMLYFENAKDSSLNFSIENHSQNTDFHYSILADKDTVKQADVTVANGQTQNIEVSLPSAEANKKITVQVLTNGNDEKEIYKVFAN